MPRFYACFQEYEKILLHKKYPVYFLANVWDKDDKSDLWNVFVEFVIKAELP